MNQIASAIDFNSATQAINFCRKARKFSIFSIVVCCFGQLLVDSSFSNLICVFIVGLTSILTFHVVIRGSIFRSTPLPALTVLGFNVIAMSGALVVQTLTFRSLVYNLKVPVFTFSLSVLFQISLLISFFIFLKSPFLILISKKINKQVFLRIGVMNAPTRLQIWIIGFIGLAAMFLTTANVYSDVKTYGEIGNKFLAGFNYLAFAPFILPILDKMFYLSKDLHSGKSVKWFLIGYTGLLILVAMIRNSRGVMMLGITNLFVGFLLILFLGQLRLTKYLKIGLAAAALITLIISPLLADLAVAMVLVRGERTQLSSQELIVKTISTFSDKSSLESYRKISNAIIKGDGYDENYISNPFLARFVNTKFFDNTLSYDDVSSGKHADKILSISIDKFMALLPTPLLEVMGININKNNLMFSMGDALYSAQSGVEIASYLTGSPIAHGFAIFKYLVFIFVIPLFLLSFIAFQSLTLNNFSFVIISPVVLLQLMSVFGLAAGDSLLGPIGYIFRSLPESIFIYWLVCKIITWLEKPVKRIT